VFNIPIIETLNDKQKCIRLFAFIDNKFSNIIRAFRESKLIDRLKEDLSQFANIGQIIQGSIIPYLTAEQYFEWKPQLGSPFKGNIVKVLHTKPTDENKNKNANDDELLDRMTSDIDKKGTEKKEIEKTFFIIDSDETFSNFKVIQMEDIEKKLNQKASNLIEYFQVLI
jgi:dihydrofolate reductase